MASTSTISRSGGTMTGTPQGAGVYNVSYTGNSMTTTTELSGSGLNNVTINLTAGQTLSLDQNRSPDGDLNIQAGTFDLSTFTTNRSAGGGTLTIAGTMKLGGGPPNNFPTNYSTMTLTGGTVEYNGSNAITQTISSLPTYANLILTNGSGSGSAAKTISANLTIINDFTINSNCVFTIPDVSDVTVGGTLSNNATAAGLVIQSSATGTGSLLHNTLGVPGTVQRYMTGGQFHIIAPTTADQVIYSAFTGTGAGGPNDISYNAGNFAIAMLTEATYSWGQYFTSVYPGGSFQPGTGYIMRRENTGIVTFAGTLRATDLSVPIPRAGYGWSAIGNPFPAPLKVRGLATGSFIFDNAAQFETGYEALYIKDPAYSTTTYRILNNTDIGGRYIDQDYIQPGQGFLVKAKVGGGNVNFAAAMRNHSNDNFYKAQNSDSWSQSTRKSAIASQETAQSMEPWSKIILKAKTSGQETFTNILFREDMTRGLDITYDAGLPEGLPEFESFGKGPDNGSYFQKPELTIYSRLVEDMSIKFAIQCLPDAETEDMVIPVGIDLPKGGLVTFTADIIELPVSYKAVLEDRQVGIFTDLKAQGAKYDAILPVGTSGTGRFFLHTQNSPKTIISAELKKINTFAVGKEIFIKGMVSENSNAIIYDLSGRKLRTVVLEPSYINNFRVDELMQGIYILKVVGKEVQVSNRVFIE